ncbi:glutathione S-transferase [Vibrio splendidus]|uniref:glutathione S-transferase C-terminal domain-containing protein n=1 Tax=Vibrio splendidus TaxID=29497 RepID=UPI00124A46D0|nr:glutathione S-transferase C-terminal domain-containing protein [Vibrio splendidus]MDH5975559.1 glutathione S-transferase [Vibrio splendidus]
MSTPILHRSLKSPYAQKIMLLMGYLEQPYLSFIAPKGIPRPIEQALVGEYSRRIPILQMGADLYCDSALILRVMAKHNHESSLTTYPSEKEALQWSERIELAGNTSIFGSIKPLELLIAYFRNMPPSHAWHFITDRAKLAKEITMPNAELSHEEKVAIARNYLEALNNQLRNHKFMLTEDRPTSVDFSAYTMIYYLDTINRLKIAKGLEHLKRWYTRMSALGTGRFAEVDGSKCLDIARQSSPVPVSEQYLYSSRIGERIAYRNGGFMAEMNHGVEGIIAGEDDKTIILRREDDQVGTVHVHFPKLGY